MASSVRMESNHTTDNNGATVGEILLPEMDWNAGLLAESIAQFGSSVSMVCGLEIGIDQRDFTASGRDWSVFIHFHYPQKEISLYCVQRIDNKNFLLFSFKSLENFRRALELMHRSTGLPVDQQQPVPTPVQPPALMDLQIAPPQQLEFKELVSQKCSERNILFAPMPGRRESGKQVGLRIKHFCCCCYYWVCGNFG